MRFDFDIAATSAMYASFISCRYSRGRRCLQKYLPLLEDFEGDTAFRLNSYYRTYAMP